MQDIGRSFKIILIGAVSTGKTSILNKLISNSFEEGTKPTLAAAFFQKIYKFDMFENITELQVNNIIILI